MGSIGAAAIVAKVAFVALIVTGLVRQEIGARTAAMFIALGAAAWFGLPTVAGGERLVTPTLAIVDIALVFAVFKRDVRLG